MNAISSLAAISPPLSPGLPTSFPRMFCPVVSAAGVVDVKVSNDGFCHGFVYFVLCHDLFELFVKDSKP